MSIDLDDIIAIDVHTHVHRSVDDEAPAAETSDTVAAMSKYFKAGGMVTYDVAGLADYYRAMKMAAITFTVDTTTRTGRPIHPTNEEVLDQAALHDDVIIPFVSIDPLRGADGLAHAEALLARGGSRGFKFHPSTQGFMPNDRAAYPLYELLAANDQIALFHTGQTGVGAGTPGGGGIHLKYADPMAIDDVAADFPNLQIILAHPSFPWQDEALSVATHKANVYIDLSGWSPKYFPPQLVRYANTLLRHKVLFGTDFPVITPQRWIDDFEKIEIRDEVKPLIMKDNAARLLGLTPEPAADRTAQEPTT